MRRTNFYLTLGLSLILAGCSTATDEPIDETPDNNNENQELVDDFVEAPKCEGTVTAKIYDSDSRATASFFTDDEGNLIDRFTATRVDVEKDAPYALVSYHGRNKEQIGLVQVIDPNTGQVKSEIGFPDARVNYCAFRNLAGKQTAYIGVDRVRKGNVQPICGVVCIAMENGKFKLDNNANIAEIHPYDVVGGSVNCFKFIEQKASSALIVATGGNNGLGEFMAGFSKFEINVNNPTKLGATDNNQLAQHFRGYWISHNIETMGGVAMPVATTYRTVENGDLVYKLAVRMSTNVPAFFDATKPLPDADAEVEVYRQKGGENVPEDFGRFAVSQFLVNQGRFLIVSTGAKVVRDENGNDLGGGVRVYRFDHSGANGKPELALVDVWDKVCVQTSNRVNDDMYVFAACTDGVYRLALDYYEDGVKADGKTPVHKVQLVPEVKRVTTALTESGTLSSTNYIQVQGKSTACKVHVAGGYEGYYVLDFNDSQFVPADPRKDLVKHD